MTFSDIMRALRTYIRSIVAVFLVVTSVGTGLYMLQPPVYTSNATVNFLPQAQGSAGQLAAALDYAVQQADVYAQLANGPTVLQPVADTLGVSSVAGSVTSWSAGETGSIVVSATSSDPTYAQDVAAATADQIVAAFDEFTLASASQSVIAKITSPAYLPAAPSSPLLMQGLMVAAVVGLVLALGQALLRSVLDNAVERPEDVARATSHRVVGEIPFDRKGQANANEGGRSVQAFSLRSEAYRRLRTNLQFLVLNADNNTVAITSSIPSEGKTETSSQLARSLSEAGLRVLLVDCDLRRPQVAKHYELDNAVGLTSALLHGTPIQDLVQHADGLDVLPSGPIPPNPSELLGSRQMKELIAQASGEYDLVLLDTPPTLPVTDVTILAQEVGGVVVIADATRVKRGQLKQAVHSLDAVNANIYGIVLNKLKLSGGGYGYGYGYSYSYGYGDDARSKSRAKGRRVSGSSGSRKRSGSRAAGAGRRSR